ncbi:MAG: CinA family protein [Anaerolineae bacterium]
MQVESDTTIPLVERLGKALTPIGWTLGTAESCTGGLIGHWITNLAGSSEFFVGGVVAYANSIKEQVLGVPGAHLEAHGAVSAEVALDMARGARRVLGCTVAVSVTGVAGPSGGTPAKPVGTVFIAAVGPPGELVRRFQWSADRIGNKDLSAQAALEMVAELLGIGDDHPER